MGAITVPVAVTFPLKDTALAQRTLIERTQGLERRS